MTRRSRRPRPARNDNHRFVREPRIADLMRPETLAAIYGLPMQVLADAAGRPAALPA